ncbi:transposable element Tcb1 transposase [Trichonephila clavipes]|nr:transposable element Tcb1 transposase [Trichonephila clavipes]
MWSMVAQRLTQIIPPAATPDQLWQRVEAASSAVPQEHIESRFESMTRRVAAVISDNGGYSVWLLILQDSAPCHTTKYLKDWYHSKIVESLSWPGNSPDFNPIENL